MTQTVTAISPGSVWVVVAGDHKNLRNRVVGTTTNRVKFTVVGKDGDNWNGGKTKARPVASCTIDEWLATRKPESEIGYASANGGTSFRRVAEPKPKPEVVMPKYEPQTGIVDVGKTHLNIEVLTVTPSLAASWLERDCKNRKRNARRVSALAAAIRRGEWQLTGDSIKLDADGCVRDGQHRLAAIVEAGVPVQSLVVRGVDEPAFDVMDSGRPRTHGDILGLHGYASGYAMAAAARNLIFYEAYGTVSPSQRDAANLVTSTSTLKYIEQHPEVLEGVHMGDRIRQAGLQGGAGLWGALATLWYRVDPDKAREFTDMLVFGAGLEAGHPALVLRNRLIRKEFGNNGKDKEAIAALSIKAWNAWREGRLVPRHLHWFAARSEAFPKVI